MFGHLRLIWNESPEYNRDGLSKARGELESALVAGLETAERLQTELAAASGRAQP